MAIFIILAYYLASLLVEIGVTVTVNIMITLFDIFMIFWLLITVN